MEEFDVIVIGGGSGLIVSSAAAGKGLKVAVVEEGPMGGTCLNRGCIPSKMIIHSADVLEQVKRAHLFGIQSKGYSVDFRKVVERATKLVDGEAAEIEQGITETENMTLFKTRARFVGERTLEVGKKKIKGEKVIIAAGTRPRVPPITGVNGVPFITSDEALRLTKQPKTLTIIGGGYISTELAHFFGTLGTNVTIVQRDAFLLPNEDKDVSEAFTPIFSGRHRVFTGHDVVDVRKKGDAIVTTIAPKSGKGEQKAIESDHLLFATGRIPNTDLLDVGKAGVKVDDKGYIVANPYLETSAQHVWAFGDIIGKYQLKHSANLEAQYVVQNALVGKRVAVDYTAMPHAIFTSPQIAGVGEREQDLVARKANFATGKYDYIRTGMGAAIEDSDGFVKVYADKKTKKILGCHIMGSDAAMLIHEVIVAMRMGGTTEDILRAVHIHPALSEVVQRAVGAIEW